MTKYKVYLVRHGKTWFNRYDKMQGWSDSPLAPDGVEVAKVRHATRVCRAGKAHGAER